MFSKRYILGFIVLLACLSGKLTAEEMINPTVLQTPNFSDNQSKNLANQQDHTKTNRLTNPLEMIDIIKKPEHLEGIRLIGNRFRIDQYVDEIVMIFFRRKGSSPVILIRPDGSKLYAATLSKTEGEWYDDLTFDMVRLKKPMIGPWQAIGQLLPDSKIMVISDVQLQAQPLPDIIFSGETIKLTASLYNAGKRIDYASFSDVVYLDVTFMSTNNNEYKNFGADSVKVARFADDGQGFDEKRKDSIFTGEFKLNIPEGQWVPSLFLDLGLFNRELLLDPIVLQPVPFDLAVDFAIEDNQQHILKITSNNDDIDLSTFTFSGEVLYPSGETQRFVIDESDTSEKQLLLFNYGEGSYSVKISAFGKNKLGRDMMLTIPDYSFNIAPPVIDTPVDLEAELLALPTETIEAEIKDESLSTTVVVLIIVIGNLFVFSIVFFLIKFVFLAEKPFWKGKQFKFWPRKKSSKNEMELPNSQTVREKPTDSDDIIDLTLPDET